MLELLMSPEAVVSAADTQMRSEQLNCGGLRSLL